MLTAEQILHLLPFPILLFDRQGRLRMAAGGAEQRFAPLCGQPCAVCFHPNEKTSARCPVCLTRKTRRAQRLPGALTAFLEEENETWTLVVLLEGSPDLPPLAETSEQRYRTIADFTYDWEYWMAPDGSLLYNSPSCQRITGRPAEDFIRCPALLEEIVHPDDRQRVCDHLRKERKSSREVDTLEYRILTPQGEERWIGHICQPVFDAQGRPQGRRASNRDNTDQKKAEQALLHAERLATIGRMVASLAHEINNPLQSLTNSLELVLNFPLDPQERRATLEGMQHEMERLQEVAGGILNLARQQPLRLTATSVPQVLQKALNVARDHIHHHQIQVQVIEETPLPEIQASPDQIEQVFLNLIINVVESMPDGGELCITLRRSKNIIEIEFADSGSGIEPGQEEYIFEPFFTTKVQGTGLGLSVSRRIVMQHGGELTARNRPGGGAVFTVALAIHPENNFNTKENTE